MKTLTALGIVVLTALFVALVPLSLRPSVAHAQFVPPSGGGSSFTGSAVSFTATAASGANAVIISTGARLKLGNVLINTDGGGNNLQFVPPASSNSFQFYGPISSGAASGNNALVFNTGARLKLGAGTDDYIATDSGTGGLLSGLGIRPNASGTAKPTCNATYRGHFWYVAAGAGVKDDVQVCAKDSADAYAWRTLY